MEFSRQEYWSGLPFPSPGDLPNPGIKPRSALQADTLPSEPPVALVSLIFLKRSLVLPILLLSSISLHCSLRKTFLSLLAILCNSAFKWVYLSFPPLPFASLLFSTIYGPLRQPFCICTSFSWGWFWSPPLVQCFHSSPGTLSDQIPWIYLSFPLYNHQGFDLGHTQMSWGFFQLSPIYVWIWQPIQVAKSQERITTRIFINRLAVFISSVLSPRFKKNFLIDIIFLPSEFL